MLGNERREFAGEAIGREADMVDVADKGHECRGVHSSLICFTIKACPSFAVASHVRAAI